jgi:hypothetical protein
MLLKRQQTAAVVPPLDLKQPSVQLQQPQAHPLQRQVQWQLPQPTSRDEQADTDQSHTPLGDISRTMSFRDLNKAKQLTRQLSKGLLSAQAETPGLTRAQYLEDCCECAETLVSHMRDS